MSLPTYYIDVEGRSVTINKLINQLVFQGYIDIENKKKMVGIKLSSNSEYKIINYLNENGIFEKCKGILKYISSIILKTPINIGNKKYNYIIVYEYMNEQSLNKYLEKKRINTNNYIDIINKIGNVLICLLKNNLTYIDLKPENVLINEEKISYTSKYIFRRFRRYKRIY